MRLFIANLVMLVAYLNLWPNLCSAQPTADSRFATEYPIAARKLKSSFATSKGAFRSTSEVYKTPTSNPRTVEIDGTFAFDHGYGKATFLREKGREGSKDELVVCKSEETMFALRRRGNSERYDVISRGQVDSEVDDQFELLFKRHYDGTYKFFGKCLDEIMKMPTFHLATEKNVKFHNGDCVEIEFEVPELRKGRFLVLLDPRLGWVIRRVQFPGINTSSVPSERILDYEVSADGKPIISQITTSSPLGKDTIKFSSFTYEHTPEAEFNMAYYGLPDITRPPGPSLSFLWLSIIAVSLILAAYALQKLSKKRQIQVS